MTIQRHYDLVVLGTGLAAVCLARQLSLELPELSVLTLDRAGGPGRTVGESLVEIAGHYVYSRLQLGEYLIRHQLPKNGLRFFFDNPDRSLPLEQASEDGAATFSYWRTFQIERDTFEQAVCEMNARHGVVHLWNVGQLRAEPGDRQHRVSFEQDGRTHTVRCDWLVDGTGFDSVLGRQLGTISIEQRENHGACWSRYSGFRSPDQLLAERRDRRQPICAPRLLSTNHMMHRGYWIWWIPLASGQMSVGLVYDRTLLPDAPETAEAFDAFIRSHRMCRELMEQAELVHFGRMERMAYLLDRAYAPERIAWIGASSGFLDPFYSPGSDFIALKNECLVKLIAADRAGQPLEADIARYHTLIKTFYEHAILWTQDQYAAFGSYELFVPKYRRDLHCYWNLFVWPYFSGEITEPAFLERFGPVLALAHQRSSFFNRLYRHACGQLEAQGALHRSNAGRYSFNQLGFRMFPYINFERQMGTPADPALSEALLDEIDRGTFLTLLELLHGGDRYPLRKLLFDAVDMPALLELERCHGFSQAFWDGAVESIAQRLCAQLESQRLPLPQVALDLATLPDLRRLLRQACGSDSALRQRADRLYLATPELSDLSRLPEMKQQLQPDVACRWTFEHTPWELGQVNWKTKYELLDELDEVSSAAPA